MKVMKTSVMIAAVILLGAAGFTDKAAAEKTIKIATISIQDILAESAAGQEAKTVMEAKVLEYQDKFQAEQNELDEIRKEIEKKSSVWSEEVRQEKEREYQKKLRELQLKSEDAQFELQKLEKKIMAPILKDLHEVIAVVGKQQGYTMILENTRKGLESRSGLLYADETLDISALVRKELEARSAAAPAKAD